MAKDTFHVVPHGDEWSVKREGSDRNSSTHATQKEAIDSARGLAGDGDDIVIHRPDGTIRERVTHAGAANGGAGTTTETRPRAERRDVVEARDIVSVGSRVSWQAILAGLAVAVTTYIGRGAFWRLRFVGARCGGQR